MARWKLNSAHYLKVPGTEWEYKETNRQSGREVRERIPVPRFLDPNDPNDWTDRSEEMVVVCWKDRGKARDIVFDGDPTPDMDPLDEEAIEVSNRLRPGWVDPVNALPAQGGMEHESTTLNKLEQMMSQFSKPVPAVGRDPLVAELMAKVEALTIQMAQMQVKEHEPLEDITPTSGEIAVSEAQASVGRRA